MQRMALVPDPVSGVEMTIKELIGEAADDYRNNFLHAIYWANPPEREKVMQDAERVVRDRLPKEFTAKLNAQLGSIK